MKLAEETKANAEAETAVEENATLEHRPRNHTIPVSRLCFIGCLVIVQRHQVLDELCQYRRAGKLESNIKVMI